MQAVMLKYLLPEHYSKNFRDKEFKYQTQYCAVLLPPILVYFAHEENQCSVT